MQEPTSLSSHVAVERAFSSLMAEAYRAAGATGADQTARLERLGDDVDRLRAMLEQLDHRALIDVHARLTRLRRVLRQGLDGTT